MPKVLGSKQLALEKRLEDLDALVPIDWRWNPAILLSDRLLIDVVLIWVSAENRDVDALSERSKPVRRIQSDA